MAPNEFKAWFDGFTEAFTGCPTKAQWTRIKARVAEIDGKPVTHTVYMDRYLPSYPLYPTWRHLSNSSGVGVSNTAGLNDAYSLAQNSGSPQNLGQATAFNSMQAMADLGRAEAKGIA